MYSIIFHNIIHNNPYVSCNIVTAVCAAFTGNIGRSPMRTVFSENIGLTSRSVGPRSPVPSRHTGWVTRTRGARWPHVPATEGRDVTYARGPSYAKTAYDADTIVAGERTLRFQRVRARFGFVLRDEDEKRRRRFVWSVKQFVDKSVENHGENIWMIIKKKNVS